MSFLACKKHAHLSKLPVAKMVLAVWSMSLTTGSHSVFLQPGAFGLQEDLKYKFLVLVSACLDQGGLHLRASI
jgi:hypothetical protein